MKALVCVKQVVDHKVKIRIRQDRSGVDTADVKLSINPFDEIAVEEAVRLKEKGAIGEIVAVSAGGAGVADVLRTALAMGADRAIHLQSDAALAPLTVAKALAALCDEENPDLILLGKQAIDDDCNQVGQMLAALRDLPQATNASEITLADGSATVTREVDGGLETLRLTLPAAITADLRLNAPRNISLPSIMKAKKKPLESRSLESLGVATTSRLTTLRVEEPAARAAGVMVDDVDALVSKLKNAEQLI
ncbi:electron transfer flavoprotein subunit beta/FixA family protein [Pluralibacter gergoviae]|uniref:electron transfer flavoprotein subunit beta/FixA family protein n=1 Tax=Pluralibacter gergoviae TaxID=61647 RepID=UPI00065109E4|nr:electron transfer flavoprotein subunit beta/FixA family protein [Pluralibacter gergoviae]EKV6247824.1 electron transfer flavoprotein subunit beta/FixA family protein [Pluralibacter gergoviae]EKW9966544.1 electron transfer flavoprotein subunit beta/FixA family protein [Pluralibacter gergoviae]ELD4300358.1 electron transfer flavoprotein subunit beta/FixA family protein [Pluralibacter gergoviae]ELN2737355.1 electron transfer flavoprotein subunit beta/FixA family protein [Pluralibacter gergoviae